MATNPFLPTYTANFNSFPYGPGQQGLGGGPQPYGAGNNVVDLGGTGSVPWVQIQPPPPQSPTVTFGNSFSGGSSPSSVGDFSAPSEGIFANGAADLASLQASEVSGGMPSGSYPGGYGAYTPGGGTYSDLAGTPAGFGYPAEGQGQGWALGLGPQWGQPTPGRGVIGGSPFSFSGGTSYGAYNPFGSMPFSYNGQNYYNPQSNALMSPGQFNIGGTDPGMAAYGVGGGWANPPPGTLGNSLSTGVYGIESTYGTNPVAMSMQNNGYGAYGPMQLTKPTAQAAGLPANVFTDPLANMQGGNTLLQSYLGQGYSPMQSAAVYNYGKPNPNSLAHPTGLPNATVQAYTQGVQQGMNQFGQNFAASQGSYAPLSQEALDAALGASSYPGHSRGGQASGRAPELTQKDIEDRGYTTPDYDAVRYPDMREHINLIPFPLDFRQERDQHDTWPVYENNPPNQFAARGGAIDQALDIARRMHRAEGGATPVPATPMPILSPKTLDNSITGEPGFAYHVTNEHRLNDIAHSGKLRTHRPGDFTDQNSWPDGSTKRRSYFAPHPLGHFAPEKGRPVVLRTRMNDAIKRERGTGDLYSEKPTPSSQLEYLHESGAWHPLTPRKRAEGGGLPSLPGLSPLPGVRELPGGHATHGKHRLHVGPIHSVVAGRTDHLPTRVPTGSYVIPADIISALGDGNSMSGFRVMKRIFSGVPYSGGGNPYGQGVLPYGRARGGTIDHDEGIPCVLAGGEFIIPPHHVAFAGDGDKDIGHQVLDGYVLDQREKAIKTMKGLPGPKKD